MMNVNGFTPAQNNQSEEYFLKCRKAANIVKQVLHSKSCSGSCCQPSCSYFKRLSDHMNSCVASFCTVSGCETTKKLMTHHDTCKANKSVFGPSSQKACLICQLVASPFPNASISTTASETKSPIVRPRSRSITEININRNRYSSGFFVNTDPAHAAVNPIIEQSTYTTNDNVEEHGSAKRSRAMSASIIDSIPSDTAAFTPGTSPTVSSTATTTDEEDEAPLSKKHSRSNDAESNEGPIIRENTYTNYRVSWNCF